MDLPGLAAHAATASALLPYLASAGRYVAIAALVYYTVKAAVLGIAAIVGICTKDEKRRTACLEIVRTVGRGWPWQPRLPG